MKKMAIIFSMLLLLNFILISKSDQLTDLIDSLITGASKDKINNIINYLRNLLNGILDLSYQELYNLVEVLNLLNSMGIKVTEEKLKLTAQNVVLINGLTNGIWTAKLGYFSLLPDEYQKRLSGVTDIEMETITGIQIIRNRRQTSNSTKKCNYTTEFDVRDKWPKCSPFLNHVPDQAFCGCCWAMSTASAYTDRHCIERDKMGLSTLRTANTIFSSYELLSCTSEYTSNSSKYKSTYDCRGGSPYKAWELIKVNGICTGSDYLGEGGCKPYPFGPKNSFPILKDCYNKCTNKTWGVPYDADRKNYVTSTGTLKGEQAIKDELNKNGPVVAIYNVYKDFYFYASGEDGVYFVITLSSKTCTNIALTDHYLPVWDIWDWGDKNNFLRVYICSKT